MIKVQVRSNEPLEAALRRFKRQCNYAGVFRLAKKYSFYEKRSDKNRREDRERVRNIQRAIRKAEERQRPRGRKKSKVKGTQVQEGQTEGEATKTESQTAEAKAGQQPQVDDRPASAGDLAGALQARGVSSAASTESGESSES